MKIRVLVATTDNRRVRNYRFELFRGTTLLDTVFLPGRTRRYGTWEAYEEGVKASAAKLFGVPEDTEVEVVTL